MQTTQAKPSKRAKQADQAMRSADHLAGPASRRSMRRHLLAILWPAFLMAGVLEVLVFALVDPAQLRWLGGATLALSPSAVYTLGFFVFWAVVAAAGMLTRLLEGSAADINREGASGAFRH